MKAQIVHATKLVIRYLGPVANAVHGELSRQETARSLAQFVIVWAGGGATAYATLKDPNFVNTVIVPLGGATLTGVMDAMGRLEHGVRKPPVPEPVLPPVPPDEPPPRQL